MKKIILLLLLLSTLFTSAQTKLILTGKSSDKLQKILDSAMQSKYFITIADATKILDKPAHVKDSTYRYASGILKYSFDYVVSGNDSTSKGKLFFAFEQYDNYQISKATYQSIKTENERTGTILPQMALGEDAFICKDNLNQPFLIVLNEDKIFKFKVYFITTQVAIDQLIRVAGKTIKLH